MRMWSKERDAMLLACRAASVEPHVIVRELERKGVIVAASDVRKRLKQLGKPIRSAHDDRFWTRERDEQLRQLWAREPRMLIDAIREEMQASVGQQNISARAMKLGLPPRNPSAGRQRLKFEQSPPRHALTKASVRVLAPLETPCPYIDCKGATCGVMVDRRIRANGAKPSQYCEEHAPRVLPISRGPIGVLATYAKGARFYG